MDIKFKPLADILVLKDDLSITEDLWKKQDTCDLDNVAKCLLKCFYTRGFHISLLQRAIENEVEATAAASLLFRGNSIASKMMSAFSRLVGGDYLRSALSGSLESIKSAGAFEVDSTRAKEGTNLEENMERLKTYCGKFLDAIICALAEVPRELREVCQILRATVEKKFPEAGDISIGGFFFLRFVCPAIVTPPAFRLLTTMPPKDAMRGLILSAKTLQNLVNGVLTMPEDCPSNLPALPDEDVAKAFDDLFHHADVYVEKIPSKEGSEQIEILRSEVKRLHAVASAEGGKKQQDDFLARLNVLNSEIDFTGVPGNANAVSESLLEHASEIVSDMSTVINGVALTSYTSLDFDVLINEMTELQKVDLVSLSPTEMTAFFTNIYNLLSFHAFLQHGPLKPNARNKKYFKRFAYNIAGYAFTLDDIFEGILRCNIDGHFKKQDPRVALCLTKLDPRIHFCCSPGIHVSGPQIHLFRPKTLEKDICHASQDFLRDVTVVKAVKKKVKLSKMFEVYRTDFGRYKTDAFRFLGDYLDNESRKTIQSFVATGDYVLSYIDVDTTPRATIFNLSELSIDAAEEKEAELDAEDIVSPHTVVGGANQQLIESALKDDMWVLNIEQNWAKPGRPAFEVSLSLVKEIVKLCDRFLFDWQTIGSAPEFKTFSDNICELQQVHIGVLPRAARMAFFINIYHTMVLHFHASFGAPGTSHSARHWLLRKYRYQIGSYAYTLEDIYNGILRGNPGGKTLRKKDARLEFIVDPLDPRIHFALSHLTKTSPPLRFYRPETLNEQLNNAVSEHLAKTLQIIPEKKKVKLPHILKEFRSDWGQDKNSVFSWLSVTLPEDQQRLLLAFPPNKWKLDFADSSWSTEPCIVDA